MATTAHAPCFCGSGRALSACHAQPRRARREHRAQLRALGELHDLSALFPDVRPHDEALLDFAEQVAAGLDPNDPRVPPELVEDGVALLGRPERRRIVDDWARRYPSRWASACAAVGNVILAERTAVASAVRGAISERRPVSRQNVEMFENGDFSESPCAALALVLAPPLVWDRDDALLAKHHVGGAKLHRDLPAKVEEYAAARVDERHVERLRVVSDRLRRQLPIDGLPTASATLADGCARVTADAQLAEGVACLLLVAYVAHV